MAMLLQRSMNCAGLTRGLPCLLIPAWCPLCLMAALSVGIAASALAADPFGDLTSQLVARLNRQSRLPIMVGDFLYEDTVLFSPFSLMLRDEIRGGLVGLPHVAVVTRERLSELMEEKDLLQTSLFQPGTDASGIRLKEAAGLIRGRFYPTATEVRVTAELVRLGTGEVIGSARATFPAASIGARLYPDAAGSVEAVMLNAVQPAQMQQSLGNLADVGRIAAMPREFDVRISVLGNKIEFSEGERVGFSVWSEVEAYVALLLHTVKGDTVMIFPNPHQRSGRVPAGRAVSIPPDDDPRFYFYAKPLFGADVIQVIACTHREPYEQLVRRMFPALAAPGDAAFPASARSLVRSSLDDRALGVGEIVPRWSEARVTIQTLPNIQPPR